ncbi:MAG: FAD-dependent oxidoreductase [Anaerolineae bacterium]|nr:FAD-dependent oxidoreductase [Anaerolineae bacterium]
MRLADGSLRMMAEARVLYPDFDVTRSWDLSHAPQPEADESLETYLRRIGFTEAQLDYTQRSFANAACETLAHLSARSCADEWEDYGTGMSDHRVLDGYNHIHGYLADGLNIRLNVPVARIDWGVGGVRVQAVDGTIFEGDSAVITLPVGVLRDGAVRFTPDIPDEKRAALEGLSMGPAIKLIFMFDQPVLPNGIGALYSAGCPPMWWSPSFGRDTDVQVITAFATGDYARELEALGEDGALDTALQVLRDELDCPDIQPVAARWINWTADPYSLGGYSVATPGAHEARLALAQPTPPLFWAGEATVKNAWAATVHGALISGQRAADQVQQFLLHPNL